MSELTSEQIDNILSRIVVRKSFSDPKGHCYVSLDGRMKPIDFSPEKQLEVFSLRNKVMTMLENHKDQLTLAPELIIDELMEMYESNNTFTAIENCPPEHLWDRYGLPYILPMTTKVFARD